MLFVFSHDPFSCGVEKILSLAINDDVVQKIIIKIWSSLNNPFNIVGLENRQISRFKFVMGCYDYLLKWI